jgi:glycerol-3-phosphate O-acyltransferase/dihydroxyacetone phosphate acyltransferase
MERVQKDLEYKFRTIPKLEQSNVFKAVEEVLGAGGAVAIFPEGGSHDNSDFLPFKAGIAMMTFGTIIKTGQVPLVVPSGIKYFKRH